MMGFGPIGSTPVGSPKVTVFGPVVPYGVAAYTEGADSVAAFASIGSPASGEITYTEGGDTVVATASIVAGQLIKYVPPRLALLLSGPLTDETGFPVLDENGDYIDRAETNRMALGRVIKVQATNIPLALFSISFNFTTPPPVGIPEPAKNYNYSAKVTAVLQPDIRATAYGTVVTASVTIS